MNYLPILISLFLISLSANGTVATRARCAERLRSNHRLALRPIKKSAAPRAPLATEPATTPHSTESLSLVLNQAVAVPSR